MTKEQERKQLEKISALINEAGADSYIGITFAGVVKQAEENIANDFGSNYKEMYESATDALEEARRDSAGDQTTIYKLQEACHEYQKELEDSDTMLKKEREISMEYLNQANIAAGERDAARHEIETLKQEIITLKAKIYDLMTA